MDHWLQRRKGQHNVIAGGLECFIENGDFMRILEEE